MKLYALSPLVMTLLVLILVNVLTIGNGGWNLLSSNPTANALGILGSNALFAGLTLLWGYICVGIGYGIYKLLQLQGFIKEEAVVTTTPLHQAS
jgi:phosphate/sulfate permease